MIGNKNIDLIGGKRSEMIHTTNICLLKTFLILFKKSLVDGYIKM